VPVNTQILTDRILENENLTSNLEDEAADRLLRWGTSRVESLVQGMDDEEQAGEAVNALMAVMRKVNRIAGNTESAVAEEIVPDLETLLELYAKVSGQAGPAEPADLQATATQLAGASTEQALNTLLDWLTPA
jgi:hypothetical protein